MKLVALAAGLVALVTAAVTPAYGATPQAWYIVATVADADQSVFVDDDGERVAFVRKDICEYFMNSPEFKEFARDDFDAAERKAHGPDVKIVWTCNPGQMPGQDI